jgi:PhnB protein
LSSPSGSSKRSVRLIPEGFRTVNTYLTVPGIARLIDFLKQGFGATERGHRHLGPDGRVMHAEVKIGDTIVMLGEPGGPWPAKPCNLYVYVEDVDKVYRKAVEAGGKSLEEPKNQFYGDRSCGVEDPSGNTWWIATHVEDVSEEEMERRMAAMAKPH